MQPVLILKILVLLALANGAPVIAKKIMGPRFSGPIDAGVTWRDGRPLFGPSKTYRGLIVSILATTAGAPFLGLSPRTGALVAVAAMGGDLFSSFTKRRLGLRPSSRAPGLDQIPESLLPLLACSASLSLTAADIAVGVVVFFVSEIVLSRLLYKAHLRDEPY